MGYRIHSTALLAAAFVLLWNSGFIAAEYSLLYTGSFTLLFWHYWALTIILFVYLALRGRMKWPGFSAVALAFGVGILAHGVWLSCGLLSVVRGVPVGIVALIVSLQPMATGALSGLIVGERTYRLPVDVALFYQSLATALAVTPPAIAFEILATQWNPIFFGAMLWLIIGVSMAAYALMWLLIAQIDATRVAGLFYLGPPVTMVMAWIAFGDKIQQMDVVGLIVVSIGVLLTQATLGDTGLMATKE